jgi:hypothetical protein
LKQATPAPGSLAADAPRPPPIGPGPASHWKGPVIGAPYLHGRQHLERPEVPRV